MDSFGHLGSQRAIGTDGHAIEGGHLYNRSRSFKELTINFQAPSQVTWTPKEDFTEGYFIFRIYEESERILSHNEQGRHLKGVFLEKVCVDHEGANKSPITKDFYPVLMRLLKHKTNWGSTFAFRGLADFSHYVMEWTRQVLEGYEQTLRQIDIYGLVTVSQFPYMYDTEIWRAFCELWSPLTNTLHQGGGEMGITLNDLKQIGGLPIFGEPYEEFLPPNDQLLDESKFPPTVMELLQIHSALCKHHNVTEVSWWKWQTHFYRGELIHGAYKESFGGHHLKKKDLQNAPKIDASKLLPLHVSHKGHLAAFLAFLLSRFVLPHGGRIIQPQTFVMACLMAEGIKVSLAPTVLGHICHGLGEMATHELTPGSANPSFGIHFVIGWLGEYFSCLYDRHADDEFHEKFPLLARYAGIQAKPMSIHHARSIFRHTKYLSYRAISFGDESKSMEYLDSDILPDADFKRLLSIRSCILPVRVGNELILEPYYPNRFAHQHGFEQGVPTNTLKFSFSQRGQRSLEDIALSFARLFNRNTGAKFHIPVSYHPGSCTLGYCKWWVRISTPYVGQPMTKIHVTLVGKNVILRNPVYIVSDIRNISKDHKDSVKFSKSATSSSNETLEPVGGATFSVHPSKRSDRHRSPSDDVHFKRAKYINQDKSSDSSFEEQVDYDDEPTSSTFFDSGNTTFVENELPSFESNQAQGDNVISVASGTCFPETEQISFDATPLEIVPATLHSLLSLPMDDWVRESLENGVNSIMKQISSLKSPSELTAERRRISQSVETLHAIANLNNVNLSAFISQIKEMFDVAEVLNTVATEVDFERIETLSAALAQCCNDLELKRAEFPQLSQESIFIQEQEAELSALKEKVKGIEADLVTKKASLGTKSAALQSSIQQCESEIQQIQDELNQAGQAKAEELNAKKTRLEDLLSNLIAFAPPY